MFLRVGNKNLQQVLEFLVVGNMGPEMLASIWFQAEEKLLKNGQKIHSVQGVGLRETGYKDHLNDYVKNDLQVLVSKLVYHKGQQTTASRPVTPIRKGRERMGEAALEF